MLSQFYNFMFYLLMSFEFKSSAMKKLFLYISIALTSTISFAQKPAPMQWMEGTWKINAGNNVIVEQWHVVNDSLLSGKSVFIKNGKDTIPQESLQLVYRAGEWYYVSKVSGQNNDQPVSFKIIFLKGTEFISENPTHDFPQRIAYRRIRNQLFASIEGKNGNKYGKQNFDFIVE